ncbi:MAG: hypothetical protein ACJ8HJ_31390 [Massilia sp.]
MKMTVHLNRDSVHPGDDIESHASNVEVDPEAELGSLLMQLMRTYLPGIAGGEATWIVSCSGNGPSPLGVLAQQWQGPRLRIPAETSVAQALGTERPSISFEYWCQKDPALVFSVISFGKEPPSRW